MNSGLRERAATAIARVRPAGRDLTIALLDLDKRKEVNDTRGHAVDGLVLTDMGKICGERLRRMDIAARLGGDDFVLLMPDTDADGAGIVLENIRQSVADAAVGRELPVTVTSGARTFRDGDDKIDALLRKADEAMYNARRAGRNCIVVDSIEDNRADFVPRASARGNSPFDRTPARPARSTAISPVLAYCLSAPTQKRASPVRSIPPPQLTISHPLRKCVVVEIGDEPAHEVTRKDVSALFDKPNMRDARVQANRVLAYLRRCCNGAVAKDRLLADPGAVIERNREQAQERFLTDTEIGKLLKHLPESDIDEAMADIYLLIPLAGIWPGEAVALAPENIDIKAKAIHHFNSTKNGRSHTVPMTAQVEAIGALKIPATASRDVRRTFAPGLAGNGAPRLRIALGLNHTISGITSAYDRRGYEKKMRELVRKCACLRPMRSSRQCRTDTPASTNSRARNNQYVC